MNGYTELLSNLREIKDMGYVKTHRKGPTGIGKTLEDLLGIKENNIPGPNSHSLELKAMRKNTSSMLTLFTKSPLPWGINSELRERYGYVVTDIKELRTTLNAVSYNKLKGKEAFKIEIDNDKDRIEIKHIDDDTCWGYWDKSTLETQFIGKYPVGLLYVKADSRTINSYEEFHFNDAWILHGFGFDNFLKVLGEGSVLVDIRLGRYPDGRPHDHGTGFRVYERNLDLCFEKRIKIL